MPGFDRSRIVGMAEEELTEFTCGICQDIFIDPVVTQCCRQTYCKSCIGEWLNFNNTCPNDRKALLSTELTSPPRFVTNLLDNMKIKCEYQENGCNIQIKMCDIYEQVNHKNECDHRPGQICHVCGLEKDPKLHNCIDNLVVTNKTILDELTRLRHEIDEIKENDNTLVVEKIKIANQLRKENQELHHLYKRIVEGNMRLRNEMKQMKQNHLEVMNNLVSSLGNSYDKFVILKEDQINSEEKEELIKICKKGFFIFSRNIASGIVNEIKKNDKLGNNEWEVSIGKSGHHNHSVITNKCINVLFDERVSIVIFVADKDAIGKMLGLIDDKLKSNICDEILESTWYKMWSATDEMSVHCDQFLDKNGMDYFVSCMNTFPHNTELLRIMMGLLGNLAECPHLRHRLIKPDYFKRFINLLERESDNIEVSYSAARILSYMTSDGPSFWPNPMPSAFKRERVGLKMQNKISVWKINYRLNVNYSSFETILRLVTSNVSKEAQYWAVWTLANLTRVNPAKYCQLIVEDKGIKLFSQK